MAELGHVRGRQRRLRERARHQVLDRRTRRMLEPGALRVDRRDAAGDAERVGGHRAPAGPGASRSRRWRRRSCCCSRRPAAVATLPSLRVAQVVHRLAEAVATSRATTAIAAIRALPEAPRVSPMASAPGSTYGRDVARRQDGVHVERVDELAVGEGGAEDVTLSAVPMIVALAGAADHAAVVDADAPLGFLDGGERHAEGVEDDALALGDDGGGQGGGSRCRRRSRRAAGRSWS